MNHAKDCQCGQPHTIVIKQEKEPERPGCMDIVGACSCLAPLLGCGSFVLLTVILTGWNALFG